MTESGNNETLEIDYKSRERVRSRNEMNEISDVLLKANVERSESRYTKPAEDWPERGVFSIAISNHHPWWSLYRCKKSMKPEGNNAMLLANVDR